MDELTIRRLERNEFIDLPDEFFYQASFTGLHPWPRFIQRHYGYPFYYLQAHQGDTLAGQLVMTLVSHPIFGTFMTTSPYASNGGFVYSNQSARNALLAEANLLRQELGVEYAVVRFNDGEAIPPDGWQQHPVYASYRLDLVPNPEKLMSAYSSNHRNHIRKSKKRGFSISFGHLDLLDDVFEVMAHSMHELGSPYHHKDYLRIMADELGENLEFVVVYDSDGMLAGGGVFIIHGEVVNNLHANILHRYRSDYAGEFLYWSLIEHYCKADLKVFDLGRSLIGSGNETFKMKWNPYKQVLAYWYALPPGKPLPAINQKNPKFQLAITIWKKLPESIVRLAGPYLIRGLA